MKQIDFLPQRYYDQHIRRRAGTWRLLVCVLFGGAIAAASLAQFSYRAKVRAQLELVQPLLAEAHAASALMAQKHADLAMATHRANVCALLQSPWPRSHIVATVVKPLPETIEIQELQIARRKAPKADHRTPSEHGRDQQNDELPPAARDAAALAECLRHDETVATLTGTTGDVAALHVYVEELEAMALVVRADLLSVETSAAGPSQGRQKFILEVRIVSPLEEAAGSDRG